MRLWTLHPRHLDPRGLVAAWREALLAQKVLAGKTRGYRHHPQLARFRAQPDPPGAIAAFLAGLAAEARNRGYHFNTTKIARRKSTTKIPETRGQLLYEWKHLRAKLRLRAPRWFRQFQKVHSPKPHPLFRLVPGGVRDWEKISVPFLFERQRANTGALKGRNIPARGKRGRSVAPGNPPRRPQCPVWAPHFKCALTKVFAKR